MACDQATIDKAKMKLTEKVANAIVSCFGDRDKGGTGSISASDEEATRKTLEWLLRSNGLCPTEKLLDGWMDEILDHGNLDLKKVLEYAMATPLKAMGRDEIVSAQADLEQFFEPFDPGRSGKVHKKVFRNVFEKVGESFNREEIDEMIKECDCEEGELINYQTFLQTVMEK